MAIPNASRTRLEFLDVARGLASLMVLLEHGLHQCVPGYLDFSRAYIIVAFTGILLFFMISGFVIPLSLEEGKSNATFWQRRFFRLFPVYWFSIGLAFAYVGLGGPLPLGYTLSDTKVWIANIFLMQSLVNCPNVWDVFWSLHFEIALYVIFSVLFATRLLPRIGTRTFAALLIGFAVAFSARAAISGNPSGNGDLRLVILAAIFGFIAQRYTAGQISRGAFHGLLGGVFAATLVVWGVNHVLFPAAVPLSQLLRWVALEGLALGGFVLLLEARHRKMPQFACWLGRRSYSIYLLHPFVLLFLIPTGWPAWAFMPCLVGSTLLFAELTHRLVERPCIALGRRLEKRRKPMESAPAIENNPVRLAA